MKSSSEGSHDPGEYGTGCPHHAYNSYLPTYVLKDNCRKQELQNCVERLIMYKEKTCFYKMAQRKWEGMKLYWSPVFVQY